MAAGPASASRAVIEPPSSPRLLYASFEARIVAAAIDGLILFIIAGLLIIAGAVNLLISSDFERVNASGSSINLFWTLVGAVPPVFLLYFFLSLAIWGKTAGGAVMGIDVVRSDGTPLGVVGALARVIGMLVYALLLAIGAALAYILRGTPAAAAIFLGISVLVSAAGVLWAAVDPYRRTLHDRLAGTIVVQKA